MPLEIEVKLKIDHAEQIDAVRDRLKHHDAIPLACRVEHDTFFDLPDKSIAGRDSALRLRVLLDENGKLIRCILTFKGAQLPAKYKTRQEIELQLHRQYHPVEDMLRALGFTKVIQYQKRRETWKLDKCCIALDQLPQLGHFIEIEGSSEQAISKMIKKLDLTSAPQQRLTYLELVLQRIETGRSTDDEMIFIERAD